MRVNNKQLASFTPNVLATVPSIDMKSVATTNLYTVPTGKTAIVRVLLVITAASAITTAATAGVGIAAGEDDIHASVSMTNLFAAGDVWEFQSLGVKSRTAPADAIVKLGVDVAADGTSQTATAYVLGFLF